MSKQLGPEWRSTGIGGMPGPKPRTWEAWAITDDKGLCAVEGGALVATSRATARWWIRAWGKEPVQLMRVLITELPRKKGGKHGPARRPMERRE